MSSSPGKAVLLAWPVVAAAIGLTPRAVADGVFVRLKLVEPQGSRYYVRLGGYIHNDPWVLPEAVIPAGAHAEPARQLASGEYTPWFDLSAHAGNKLHGRMSRAGGVAELPNITANFITTDNSEHRKVVIELATSADQRTIVRRFEESFRGSLTSLLVSPQLAQDADQLETATQMTARRLAWARQASGGTAVSPKRLIIQTGFWAPQREELNLQEAEVLRLLGFNVVGNQRPEVLEKFHFGVPAATHDVDFSPAVTRAEVDGQAERLAKSLNGQLTSERTGIAVPLNFSDEITCGSIGDNRQALVHFHQWLAEQGVRPAELGVRELSEVVPIETPDELRKRQQADRAAANRVFYFTSRFRQHATTERFRWLTESVHQHLGDGPLTSTLVADHPYFSGTGLGMGMGPNPAWGRAALAADWFDLARQKAVDLAGIEDWMGLQYMYGPGCTWEGFQLMGFQAAMFRSGSRGTLPIMAWITPSDETNLRLKTASALCQGATHFFYWTYGPTATSTENYWSDLRGAYEGVVKAVRQLAAAEHVIAPGKTRTTRLALLYSISSDLWQPLGYVHMLERRGTYLSLVHDQYLVDMLTEEDVEAGRLADYDVLYVTDPCIKQTACAKIEAWVQAGGRLYGSCAAGSRNEFDEEVPGLAKVFGIAPAVPTKVQPGDYHIRGALNGMEYLDEVRCRSAASTDVVFGVLGAKTTFQPTDAKVLGVFRDSAPAVVCHEFGKGQAIYTGVCPAISYIKDARFVPAELKERWPDAQRRFINAAAADRGVRRLVELSRPVVEAGVYDADAGTALVLANFTYEPIGELRVRLCTPRPVKSVRSVEQGELQFSAEAPGAGEDRSEYPHAVSFALKLGLSDVVVLSTQ